MGKQKTTKEWVEQAKTVHGNKYDYSKAIYTSWKEKICVICPEHGEWWVEPASHLRGYGCPRCSSSSVGLSLKERRENFINKSKQVYNDIYDYSKVEYQGKRSKVCIICPEHGEFWQTPERHLKGNGCPKCGLENGYFKKRLKNTQKFIEDVYKIYNGKYDYSKVEYINNHTNICIVCPEHGEFWQTPIYHLLGYGCPKCKTNFKNDKLLKLINKFPNYDFSKAKYEDCNTKIKVICHEKDVFGNEHGEFEITPNSLYKGIRCPKCNPNCLKTVDKFIFDAIKVHGNKYDYSKVEYIDAHTKVCIICSEHGEFWQTPGNHLNGQGCSKCGHDSKKNRNQRFENFLKKAKKVHGSKYEYSKVEYINNNIPICIICPEHGEFWQVPSYHTSGNGCPKCKMSHLENDVRNYLENHNIIYDYEKKFPEWLGRQSLDFYLPDYNIAIECQGEQHFRSIKHFGGKTKFYKTLERDAKKKQLCEQHNVKLLYYTNIEFKEYGFCDVVDLFKEVEKEDY